MKICTLPTSRVCKQCHLEKPLDEFVKKDNCRFGRTHECVKCKVARNRKYIWSGQREYEYKYRETNREQINLRKRTKYSDCAETKAGAILRAHIRRSRLHGLPASFSDDDMIFMLGYFNSCCAVCGCALNGLFVTVALDHWIPVSSPDCPGTVPENIVPLCHARRGGMGGCNLSKSGKPAHTWLIETYGKRKGGQILSRIEAYFDRVTARKKDTL